MEEHPEKGRKRNNRTDKVCIHTKALWNHGIFPKSGVYTDEFLDSVEKKKKRKDLSLDCSGMENDASIL
jgi:hypothetical protein